LERARIVRLDPALARFRKNVLVGEEIMREVDGKMVKVWSMGRIADSLK
jgi:hypothetical protein